MSKTKEVEREIKAAVPPPDLDEQAEACRPVGLTPEEKAETFPQPPPPEPPTPEQRQQACQAEVYAVLQRHGCEVTAWITQERVGNIGQKVLSVAMWGIVPSQQTQQPHPGG